MPRKNDNQQMQHLNDEEFVIGRHPVKEALIANRKINKLFVLDGSEGRPIDEIINLANKNTIVISYVPKNKLDQLSDHQNHQGVVLSTSPIEYATIDELFEVAE